MTEMSKDLATILRGGVIASGLLMILGIVINMLTGDISCPTGLLNLSWIIFGDPFLAPSHVLFLGFLILLSTPLLRIMYSIVGFTRIGDKTYAVITTIVLLILLVSIFIGIGE